MNSGSVYLRCESCHALNRVPASRLREGPVCGKCKHSLAFPVRPVDAAEESFGREVFEWAGVAVVEFWSPRCGVCAMIEPFMSRLAYQKAGPVKVVKVNVEKELSLANRFQIRSTPTLLIYRNGKLIDELYGALPEHEMRAWIEAAISR